MVIHHYIELLITIMLMCAVICLQWVSFLFIQGEPKKTVLWRFFDEKFSKFFFQKSPIKGIFMRLLKKIFAKKRKNTLLFLAHPVNASFEPNSGADPEARTENGWTVLHSAACWANYEIVGILLLHGVDVNSRSDGGLTPLHLAINSSEDVEKQRITVKYLLDAPGIPII
jgi:ankyrin repeat protein